MGVAVDGAGNVWVADGDNNRVLKFNFPVSSGMGASLVLGQTDFISNSTGCAVNKLARPCGIAFDHAGNLWVPEQMNNRVVRYTSPITNNQPADLVLGQSSFTANIPQTSQTGLYTPSGVSFDAAGNIWVADYNNHRVVRFDNPITNGAAARIVLGQADFTTGTMIQPPSPTRMYDPMSMVVDAAGNLWVGDNDNNRILEFTTPISSGQAAGKVIGQTDFTSRTIQTLQTSLVNPIGIKFDPQGNLWVPEAASGYGNNRIMRFNNVDIPPAAVTNLGALPGVWPGQIRLAWAMPGEDGWNNPLGVGSKFSIQLSTWSGVVWSTSAAQVCVSTSGVVPGSLINYTVNGLSGGSTYFIKMWVADSASNWSGLSTGATVYATPNTGNAWLSKAPIPIPATLAHAGVINGTLYVAGGNVGGATTNILQAYNPYTNTWSTKTAMTNGVYEGAQAVIDNKLYVVGGWTITPALPHNYVQVYDPVADSWSAETNLNTVDSSNLNGSNVSGVINRKLYMLTAEDGYGGYRKAMRMFDPDSHAWSQLAEPAAIHDGAACAVYNGKLYVIGGYDGSTFINKVEAYDPGGNSWSLCAPMPTIRGNTAATVIGDKICVIGGHTTSTTTAVVEVYDPVADSWSVGPSLPSQRTNPSIVNINDTMYVAAGDDGISTVSTVYAYTGMPSTSAVPHTPSIVGNPRAVSGPSQNTVVLSWQASSDDGASTPLSAGSSMYIQYGTSLAGPWNYSSAQVVIATSAVVPGATVQCVIPNIVPSTGTYYFSLWTRNGPASGGNLSPQSAIASVSVPTTLSISNGVWSSTGSWQNGTLPWPDQYVNVATGSNSVYDLNDTTITCAGLMVYGTLTFDSGKADRCLTVNGYISVMNGGSLMIPPNTGYVSTLKVQSTYDYQHGFVVNQGGTLYISGQSGYPANITSYGPWPYTFNAVGFVGLSNFIATNMSSQGLVFSSSAYISDLSSGTFDNIQAGADTSYLRFNGLTQSATFYGLNFLDTPSRITNVVNAAGPGINFTFANATGDKFGASYTSALSGSHIQWTDTIIRPQSVVTVPQNNKFYNALTVVSGTAQTAASDAAISTVYVRIYDQTANTYWTGGVWSATQTWYNTGFSSPTWSMIAPSWTGAHTYSVTSRANDSLGRIESDLTSVQFVYDNTPPVSACNYPANGQYYSTISQLTGTAVDPNASGGLGAGVAHVIVALSRATDNLFWNESSSSWGTGICWNNTVAMTSSTTWSYSNAVLSTLTSGYYTVNTRAYDYADPGNMAVVFSTTTFYKMGHASKIATVVPGQTFIQGAGRSGTALNQVAGASFLATAYAVDDNNYLDQSSTLTVTTGLSDVYGINLPTHQLFNGTTMFVLNCRTAGSVAVTADAPGMIGDNQSITVIPSAASRFQLLLPGETALPGSPSGKNGVPAAQTAGVSFMTTVNACDSYWNLVTTAAPTAALTCSDTYGALPSFAALVSGTTAFTATLLRASTTTISITTSGGFLSNTSGVITVNPNAPAKLLLLMPGESWVFNGGSYKSGSVPMQVSGSTLTLTVQALDNFGNQDHTATPTIQCTVNDPNTLAPIFALSAGHGNGSFYFVNPGTFTVVAHDSSTSLATSTGSPVFVQDGTPPGAVTGLSAQPGANDGCVALSWIVPGDNGYTGTMQNGSQFCIQYAASSGISWNSANAQIVVSSGGVAPGAKVSMAITGLTGWTTYYFQIWYKDQRGNTSSLSNQASAFATDLMSPAAPVLQSPSSGTFTNNGSFNLLINPSTDSGSGIGGYHIYVSTSMDFGSVYTWLDTSNTVMPVSNLAQGVWYWRALAYDKAGNVSAYSNAWAVIVDTTAPSIPSQADPANGATNVASVKTFVVTNSSDNLSGIAGYQMQVSANEGMTAIVFVSSSSTNQMFAAGLTDGPRWWNVRSYDNAGNFSNWSSTTAFTVLGTIPAAPTNFTGTVLSTSSILWTWTSNSTTETAFWLYDGYVAIISTTIVRGSTYYLETNLHANAGITRTLRANNSNGNSSAPDPVTKYTLANPPTGLALSNAGAYTLSLSWNAGAVGDSRYYVERSSNNINYTPRAQWADQLATTSFTDTGLSSNTSYFYRIAGYNGDGVITAKTAPLVAVTAYVPPSVISGKVTQSNGTGITGVEIKAEKTGSIVSYTVYSSTDGAYTVALEQAIADGLYKVHATWIANGISATVYKDSIANGTDAVNFALETNFELSSITGQVLIASGAPRRLAPGNGEPVSPAFVELLQNGKAIARIPTKLDGSYEIPNLMPGSYSVRSFNGVAYSRATQVNLKEGQKLAMSFTYDLLQQDKVYCYPNPAVASDLATVHFETSGQDIEIAVNIYTISGELVISAGEDQITKASNVCEYHWNLQNASGSRVSSGVYLVQVKVKDKKTGETANATKKLAVIR